MRPINISPTDTILINFNWIWNFKVDANPDKMRRPIIKYKLFKDELITMKVNDTSKP
jgi:hypothetical protein